MFGFYYLNYLRGVPILTFSLIKGILSDYEGFEVWIAAKPKTWLSFFLPQY